VILCVSQRVNTSRIVFSEKIAPQRQGAGARRSDAVDFFFDSATDVVGHGGACDES